MSARMHLKIASCLLALIGLWAVTFTDYFSLLWLPAVTGLVVAAWFYEGPRDHQTTYRRIWMAIGGSMLLFFPFDVVLSRSLLLPAVHLSIFAQAYSLLNTKNERAYRRILIVSFAQILASTNLTTDLRFAVIVSAYCLVAVYFVLLMYIRGGMRTEEKTVSLQPVQEEVPRGLFVFSLVLAFALFPLSLTFFYTMPRLRYALIARGNPIDSLNQMREARQRTGFTRIVELGTYGRVQEDQTLALRVEVPSTDGRPLDKRLKWRNGALNIYDGVAWSSSRDVFRFYNGKQWTVTDKNSGTIFPRNHNLFVTDEPYARYSRAEQLDADPHLLKQVFYLEVPYSESLFGAGTAKVFQGPFRYGISRDFNGSFFINNRQALPDLMSYTVYSSTDKPSPDELRKISQEDMKQFTEERSYSKYVRKAFLQLPTRLKPQIRELAEQISRDAKTPYDKVEAIRKYLETHYTYSLDLEKPMTNDPLYDFLFVSKTGHCEYFATAMTIMCRAIGIPARLARGFQQGEWNEAGHFYEVRQRDSHAWVEVLFADYGWVDFDPSPRAAADEYFSERRSGLAKILSRQLLRLQIFWRQNVIGYNETRRLRLFGEIKDLVRNLPQSGARAAGRIADAIRTLGGVRVALVIFVLLCAPVLLRLSRKFERRIPPNLLLLKWTSRNGNGTAFYGKMLKLLAKRKIVKPHHLTPLEFLTLPPLREHPMFADIEMLTSLYYRSRYGGRHLAGTEVASVHTILMNLKRANGHVAARAPENN